jgi:hypothetical protein
MRPMTQVRFHNLKVYLRAWLSDLNHWTLTLALTLFGALVLAQISTHFGH